MEGNERITQDLIKRVLQDKTLLQNLLDNPIETVQNIYPTISEEDARVISIKSIDKVTDTACLDKRRSFWQMIIFWVGVILLTAAFGFEIYGKIAGNETGQYVAITAVIAIIAVGTMLTSIILKH
jgi:hypothetical protein